MRGRGCRGAENGRYANGRTRTNIAVDLFNIFNANAVLQQQNVYGTDGATWQKPTLVLLGRLVKLGFNLSF